MWKSLKCENPSNVKTNFPSNVKISFKCENISFKCEKNQPQMWKSILPSNVKIFFNHNCENNFPSNVKIWKLNYYGRDRRPKIQSRFAEKLFNIYFSNLISELTVIRTPTCESAIFIESLEVGINCPGPTLDRPFPCYTKHGYISETMHLMVSIEWWAYMNSYIGFLMVTLTSTLNDLERSKSRSQDFLAL